MATSNPNPVPKPKMGTEHWALMVSIVALIVSGISLWDSHRISDIQIAQAAPRLQVKHSELVRLEKTGNPNDFTLVMYTVNTGHLLAKVRESASNRIFPQCCLTTHQKRLALKT